jgi:crotonobetainyl-CoA:carnitine CoA-transferase CaiB-like acyl-CoA transferase
MAVGSEALWKRFCEGFDLDATAEGMATNLSRVTNRQQVIDLIESVFADWLSADLLERLESLGVPAGMVRTLDEVYHWEQALSQGLLIDVEHSTLGNLSLPGPPLRFFAPDGVETTRRQHSAPPTLDQDGPAVRAWLHGSETVAQPR